MNKFLINPYFPFCDHREQKASLPARRRRSGGFCGSKNTNLLLLSRWIGKRPLAVYTDIHLYRKAVCFSLCPTQSFALDLRRWPLLAVALQ